MKKPFDQAFFESDVFPESETWTRYPYFRLMGQHVFVKPGSPKIDGHESFMDNFRNIEFPSQCSKRQAEYAFRALAVTTGVLFPYPLARYNWFYTLFQDEIVGVHILEYYAVQEGKTINDIWAKTRQRQLEPGVVIAGIERTEARDSSYFKNHISEKTFYIDNMSVCRIPKGSSNEDTKEMEYDHLQAAMDYLRPRKVKYGVQVFVDSFTDEQFNQAVSYHPSVLYDLVKHSRDDGRVGYVNMLSMRANRMCLEDRQLPRFTIREENKAGVSGRLDVLMNPGLHELVAQYLDRQMIAEDCKNGNHAYIF